MDIFQSDPKLTVSFEHGFISASLTLRVQADSYPLAVQLDQDSSELFHAIFCEAIEKSAVRVAKTVAESHAEFQTAFANAVGVVRRRS